MFIEIETEYELHVVNTNYIVRVTDQYIILLNESFLIAYTYPNFLELRTILSSDLARQYWTISAIKDYVGDRK